MDLVILVLATWRIASLLAQEDGPFDLFERLRVLAGTRYNQQSEPVGLTPLAQGLLCVWCTSVWVGALMTLAYWRDTRVVWLAMPLALSAGAILIQRLTGD